MINRAWKATLQNGLQVEIDYTHDVDELEVIVGSEDDGWQQIPDVDDRTPIVEVWDKLDIDRIWVATLAKGDQILVNYWHQTYFQATDELTIAYREDRWSTWRPPVTCEPVKVTAGDVDDI
jgi:hypothetical protein